MPEWAEVDILTVKNDVRTADVDVKALQAALWEEGVYFRE